MTVKLVQFKKKNAKPSPKLTKLVKKITQRQAETKRYYINPSGSYTLQNGITLGENLPYWIAQGTGDDDRIGDKIQIQSIKIYLALSNHLTTSSSSTSFRIMVYRSSEQVKTGTVAFALGTAGVADGCPDTGYFGYHNSDKITMIKDMWVNLPSSPVATSTCSKMVSLNIPVSSGYQYSADNGGYSKNKNIYFAIMAYNDLATASANTGYVNMSYSIFYKDM